MEGLGCKENVSVGQIKALQNEDNAYPQRINRILYHTKTLMHQNQLDNLTFLNVIQKINQKNKKLKSK